MAYNSSVPRSRRIPCTIASSARNRLRYSCRKIHSFNGSTKQRSSLEAITSYARQVVVDIFRYGRLEPADRAFLTIPDVVFRLTEYDTDRPNRRMLLYYRAKMNELSYEYEAYINNTIDGCRAIHPEIITHEMTLVASADHQDIRKQGIDAIRHRLAQRIQESSDEELPAATVFLVARKPAKP